MLLISPLIFLAVASDFALGHNDAEQSELEEMPKAVSGDDSDQQEAWAFITSPDDSVSGAVQLTNIPGSGTKFVLEVEGLPEDDPDGFMWHVHESPVTGDCSTTGSHLNPTGSTPGECGTTWQGIREKAVQTEPVHETDPEKPWFCEEGDMSGKHGVLESGSNKVNFVDAYVRWEPEEYSVLGRAITIHDANGDAWACGNITTPIDGTAGEDGEPTRQASTYQTYPESDWPELAEDNVGWTPAIWEAPEVGLKVDEETGERWATVPDGQGGTDTAVSSADSMIDESEEAYEEDGEGEGEGEKEKEEEQAEPQEEDGGSVEQDGSGGVKLVVGAIMGLPLVASGLAALY